MTTSLNNFMVDFIEQLIFIPDGIKTTPARGLKSAKNQKKLFYLQDNICNVEIKYTFFCTFFQTNRCIRLRIPQGLI